MTLRRSASAQRRRSSRSPAELRHSRTNGGAKVRRASVGTGSSRERHRSPRHVRDFDAESDSPDECYNNGLDSRHYVKPRDTGRPSRSTLNAPVPMDYYQSPRNSLTPRKSLTPDIPHNPQNSFISDAIYARNNYPLVGSRSSLLPENGSPLPSRSPRHSLVPQVSRSPRGSVANIEHVNRSPRTSICPDPACISRSPRRSITVVDMEKSPRGSIDLEHVNHSPRRSIPDIDPRSPRGSICPEINHSPRGSTGGTPRHRSPRCSIGVNELDRHSRTSITVDDDDDEIRSQHGSVDLNLISKTAMCSLNGTHESPSARSSMPLQDLRRPSIEQVEIATCSPCRYSPHYKHRNGITRSPKSGGSGATLQPNGNGNHATGESRRASSSVSQFSVDESRRLCMSCSTVPKSGYRETVSLRVVTYGSVTLGLKDADREADNACDFVYRGLKVISKTRVVTVMLTGLCVMALLMFIFGLNFFEDCLIEPSIPIYLVIGGSSGMVYSGLLLYCQIRSTQPDMVFMPSVSKRMSPMTAIFIPLTCFVVTWFILGNYWILCVMWPEFVWPPDDPNIWCDKTLYVFSFTHLCIIHGVLGLIVLLSICLLIYRAIAWYFPDSV